MKLAVWIGYVVIIGFLTLHIADAGLKVRRKRGLIQLGLMIDCSERTHGFPDYNGYGCWCGIGGSGTPLDATDSCCRTHDHCYDALHAQVGGPCLLRPQVYIALYKRFNCNYCADISAYNHWWYRLLLASPRCRHALCECDATLVRCLRRVESTFNPDYRYYYKRLTACRSLLPWIPMLPNGVMDVGSYGDANRHRQRPQQQQQQQLL